MFREEGKQKIEMELNRGGSALQSGYPGRARVCARRAAGEAVREYLAAKGLPSPGPSAIDLLEAVLQLPEISGEMRLAVQRLLMRVGEDFSLPEGIDLLADARWFAQELEKQCCGME